ncbi:hypothetical protein ZOSMA_345G00270 [Zostera marina]|uniref:Uncharacterized protein n=1 Tax=Zostera marina TaxID=29655 RepID=A0A0K9P9P6_ZOSMR|nr:hypothetical protein ZOSMA_345G00270 [Zostera marina]
MGNCQTAEAEAAMLQHPDGKMERLYWPTVAIEVMRINPGHHVALATILSLPTTSSSSSDVVTPTTFRLTKLRLLRPKETLVQGRVYRLVTSEEVVKALKMRKQARLRNQQMKKKPTGEREEELEVDVSGGVINSSVQQLASSSSQDEAARLERHRQKAAQSAAKARQWRPSLQSISEAVA